MSHPNTRSHLDCIVTSHERNLLAYYGNDPDRFVIGKRFEGRGVFVLFTNRCGSHFFVDLLNQQPNIRLEYEVFNTETVIDHSTRNGLERFEDYVQFLRGLRRPTLQWGAKVGVIQLAMLYRFGLMNAFEKGTRLIWLKRKDIVAQAVSHFIADTTKQWTSFQDAIAPTPDYRYESIAAIVSTILRQNAQAEMTLAATGIRFTSLWYEELLNAPNYHMRRIATFAGVPFKKLALDKTGFRKQSDPVKDEYASRFLEDCRRNMGLTDAPYAPDSPVWGDGYLA